MRVSVQTSRVFENFGIEDGFAALRDAGFEAVDFGMCRFLMPADIRSEKPGSVMDGDFEDMISQLTEFRDAAQHNGIAFAQTHAPFPSYAWGMDTLNARMAHVQINAIKATAFLGAPCCVIHPAKVNENAKRPSPSEEWTVNRDMYAALIPVLRETGVVCCLENMFSNGSEGTHYASACSDPCQTVQWIDDLNSMAGAELFGFCLDTGHCNLTRQTLGWTVLQLGKHIKVLHIHDNMGHLDQHLSPYMGNICWDEFLNALRKIGYGGDLSFETANVLNAFPHELHQECLRLIAKTGQLFRSRLLSGL